MGAYPCEFSTQLPRIPLLWTASYFEENKDQLPPTVLREIWIIPPRFCVRSLRYILQRTDEELSRVAELCDAKVIPHEWGLVRGSNPFFSPKQVPRDKHLVAKVNVIKPADNTPSDIEEKMIEGVSIYNSKYRRYGIDMHKGQFMYGVNSSHNDEEETPSLYLVDIEPKFRSIKLRMPLLI